MKIPHTYLFTSLIQFQVLSIMAHSRSWSWRKRQIIPGIPQSLTMAQRTHGPSRVRWPKCHILLKLVLWNAHWDICTLKRRRSTLPIQDQIISQGVSLKLCLPSSEEREDAGTRTSWRSTTLKRHLTSVIRNLPRTKKRIIPGKEVTLISALETPRSHSFLP